MQRPLLTPLVVGFWFVTTGWLVVDKIVPSLSPGSPPGYQALHASGSRLVPVAWSVSWNDRPIGWATSAAERTHDGGLVVSSRLRFERLPIEEMLPRWTRALVRGIRVQDEPERSAEARQHVDGEDGMTFEAAGRLTIDAEGRLRSFNSIVTIPGTAEKVFLNGAIEDDTVTISVHGRGLHYETRRFLPSHVMIGDEFSPQATLPGLYPGRRWTVPIYSPLRPGHSPIEVLHAHVSDEDTILWQNEPVAVHVVTYRDDPTSHREPRCRLWVDGSGRVLKQEASMLGCRMTFLRLPDDEAARRAGGEDLPDDATPDAGRRLPPETPA
ncbi:MAG: hypothetical protein EBZ59_07665 [Planctomycetia bacterium]|nr:hypothetical protein [Planctomycetia bacterium]